MPKPLQPTTPASEEIQDRLAKFQPRKMADQALAPVQDIDMRSARRDDVGSWVSREPAQLVQLSIKGPPHIVERFKRMCIADRRKYFDMLEILMDNFEGK